jgi:signal transduction histidine kinase
LSRSIYRISVRVQDMARRLDQKVGSVHLIPDGDLQGLDQQVQRVVRGVEEVAERLQQHQREMLRAEQLSAVGQLAAGVAHEVRNPLTAIKMLVEAALRPGNTKPLTTQDLKVIHGEIARLEQRVQAFLNFARLPIPRRTTADLRDVVTRATELIRARARQQNVEIVINSADGPVLGFLDQEQMQTVLINLLLNALDAMPHGGRLDVAVAPETKGKTRIIIADTGSGIPREMTGRLFVPFASTKPTGTGLGLSLSQRIVEEHGGSISAGNRSGGGACFTIDLPAQIETKANGAPAVGRI